MSSKKPQESIHEKSHLAFAFNALLFALELDRPWRSSQEVCPRIGFLDPTSRAVSEARIEAFRQGLRKLGYTEGKNIAIGYRFAEGKSERLHDLASELVHLNVDVIIARAIPGTVAAKQATRRSPSSL